MATYNAYTPEQISFLVDHSHLDYAQVVALFNEKFNTDKTVKKIALACSRNGFHCKKNARPKGLKRHYKNGSPSHFKKGCEPNTRSEIGTERVRPKDGYIEIKTSRGWEMKQRVIWEREKGEIPKGYVVFFKDLNRQNCRIENLICVPRGVVTIANRFFQFKSYPREAHETVFLMAHLKHKLHNHTQP
jgi:hypothetical protein